jgi:hypothetical protein
MTAHSSTSSSFISGDMNMKMNLATFLLSILNSYFTPQKEFNELNEYLMKWSHLGNEFEKTIYTSTTYEEKIKSYTTILDNAVNLYKEQYLKKRNFLTDLLHVLVRIIFMGSNDRWMKHETFDFYDKISKVIELDFDLERFKKYKTNSSLLRRLCACFGNCFSCFSCFKNKSTETSSPEETPSNYGFVEPNFETDNKEESTINKVKKKRKHLGTESVILAAEAIRAGKAKVMRAGSCDSFGPHIWGGFDSMRVLARHANDQPTLASAPLSDHAAGFVPAAGAGALILEDWDHALARGVPILAEYLDGATLAGGQRNGGTMTAPNPEGVRRCLTTAMQRAEVLPQDIDLISGHLTSTMGDRAEVAHWAAVLNGHFPFLQAPKTYVGHCLAAAGAIEAVSCVLQLQKHFILGNANSRPLHPDIAAIWPEDKIPTHTLSQQTTKVVAKSSFGFGDVNACFFLKRCE